MPFLRFARDKRGYETTSLVHTARRQGRARPRILYWFRTPPGVKVGRPALDEEAIRWIEEHNPDIEFNWQKILEAPQHVTSPSPDEFRHRRGRRDKPARRAPAPQLPAPAPHPLPQAEENEVEAAEQTAEAVEQLIHPDIDETIEPSVTPVERSIDHEQLTRLRARYAELQARITERGGDAERTELLRAQAESLNPDTWVTEEETQKGLAGFESKLRDLRAALGLRRRRRSRRGGHRRQSVPPENGSAAE